jgi:nucleoside-diphosphate-sugar epimerase
VTVVPGSVYGPSPLVSRALAPTSFNRLIRGAVRGRLAAYPSVSALWVRAEDVAAVAVSALEKADPGDRYLAIGAEDAIAARDFFNMACSLAGSPHRVAPLTVDPSDPAVVGLYGESMVESFGRPRPVPAADASWTRRRLSVRPADVVAALTETVGWLRSCGQIA